MEKVKYLKFEQQDGTFTDKIPLALDSTQVDTSSIGIDNLKDILDTQQAEIQAANLEINSLSDVNGRLERKEATNKTNLEAMLEYIPDGSPLGYYSTVAALIAANPISGTYIIQENSHIYSWTKNGVTAIDLGLYRAEPDEEAKEKLNRFKMIYNVFPKIEGEDTEITLDNTADSPLSLGLKTSDSTQNTSILPDGYTQVDYIESNGNQYIDTGLNADSNLSLEMVILSDDHSVQRHMGAIKNDNGVFTRHHITFNASNASSYIGSYFGITNTMSVLLVNFDDNKHYLNLDVYNKQISVDNESPTTLTFDAFDTNLNYWLFGRNSNNSSQISFAIMRLYSCKMYVQGVLMRNFIPCYRNSDNEVGLYDLVNNVFYTNQRTGSFTYGNIVNIPTPDYPQDIHVIKGDNKIVIKSKNLAYISSIYAASYTATLKNNKILINGTSTSSGNIQSILNGSDGILLKANKTYTVSVIVSGEILGTGYRSIYMQVNNGTISIGRLNSNTVSQYTITPSEDVTSHWINFDLAGNLTFTNVIVQIQIEENNEVTSYVEHKEQSYPINLGVKNLFDKDNITTRLGYIKNNNGIDTADTEFGYITSFINVKPNTDYILFGQIVDTQTQSRIYFYDENQNWISRSNGFGNGNNELRFTTLNNCYYIQFQFNKNVFDKNTLQIEEGNTAHSYSPYGQTPIEMCKISTYADELFKNVPECEYYDESLEIGKWYKLARIGKIVLNGTENWFGYRGQSAQYLYRAFGSSGSLISANTGAEMMSNYFKQNVNAINNANDNGIYCLTNNILYMSIDKNLLDDTEPASLKKFLLQQYNANSPVIVYYVFATPENILLSNTLQTQLDNILYAMAYQDQTNISQANEDRPFVINASTVKDMSDLGIKVATLESEV